MSANTRIFQRCFCPASTPVSRTWNLLGCWRPPPDECTWLQRMSGRVPGLCRSHVVHVRPLERRLSASRRLSQPECEPVSGVLQRRGRLRGLQWTSVRLGRRVPRQHPGLSGRGRVPVGLPGALRQRAGVSLVHVRHGRASVHPPPGLWWRAWFHRMPELHLRGVWVRRRRLGAAARWKWWWILKFLTHTWPSFSLLVIHAQSVKKKTYFSSRPNFFPVNTKLLQ